MSRFKTIFASARVCPVIGVIHLPPLPGAPDYDGDMPDIINRALADFQIYQDHSLDGVIIENFGDTPFYPGRVPAETVAAMTRVITEITRHAKMPVGVNILRNDAESALTVAAATGASFIRVNVHTGAVVADQGIIEGRAHESLRLRQELYSDTMILADIGVKHATTLGARNLADEAADTVERGRADGLIITGASTGAAADIDILEKVRNHVQCPVIIGSGITFDAVLMYSQKADALIVGSAFKQYGKTGNSVETNRVATLMAEIDD